MAVERAPGDDGRQGSRQDTASSADHPAAAGEPVAATRGPIRPVPGQYAEDARPPADRLEQAEVAPLTRDAELRINLLRNIRYHEDREAHFAFWNSTADLVVILAGFGVMASAFGALTPYLPERWAGFGPLAASAFAGLATIAGAVQLVFGTARKEFVHADFRRRFLVLDAKRRSQAAEASEAEMWALVAEEPPTFYACDALAYNAAQRAAGRTRGLEVRFGHRALRHFCRFEATVFKEVTFTAR